MAPKDKVQLPPGASTSSISTAPEPGAGRAESFDAVKIETPRDTPEGESLYWFGTLLMKDSFEMRVPASMAEIDAGMQADENGDFYKSLKTTAWNLWFTGQQDIGRFWAARNGYYQNLDVTGLTFPAFTERSEMGGTNEAITHKELWPGSIARLNDTQVRNIVESVQNHALRPKGPMWTAHPGADIVNYKSGHMPGCPGGYKLQGVTCQTCHEIMERIPESNQLARRISNAMPEYRRRGDLPFSDYVYLLRLKAPVDTSPKLFHRLVSSLPEFFMKQPPPLSEDLAKAEAGAAA